MPRSAFRLRAKRSSPIQQKRARDALPICRRRDRPWRLHALQNDLELLVIRPASTSPGINDSQPFNLSTVLIAVHKDCYTALTLIRQGGPHRRKTLGIRGFNPKLKKAAGRLEDLRTPEGEPIPPNTLAELHRDMERRRLVSDQIRQIEEARLERMEQAPGDGPHATVRLIARVIGVGC